MCQIESMVVKYKQMKIRLNGNIVELPDGSSLPSVFQLMKTESDQGIALAVNNKVVPKKEWQSCVLKENDNVLLIRASQGG